MCVPLFIVVHFIIKIGDDEIASLKKKLEETERVMKEIMIKVNNAPANETSTPHNTTDECTKPVENITHNAIPEMISGDLFHPTATTSASEDHSQSASKSINAEGLKKEEKQQKMVCLTEKDIIEREIAKYRKRYNYGTITTDESSTIAANHPAEEHCNKHIPGITTSPEDNREASVAVKDDNENVREPHNDSHTANFAESANVVQHYDEHEDGYCNQFEGGRSNDGGMMISPCVDESDESSEGDMMEEYNHNVGFHDELMYQEEGTPEQYAQFEFEEEHKFDEDYGEEEDELDEYDDHPEYVRKEHEAGGEYRHKGPGPNICNSAQFINKEEDFVKAFLKNEDLNDVQQKEESSPSNDHEITTGHDTANTIIPHDADTNTDNYDTALTDPASIGGNEVNLANDGVLVIPLQPEDRLIRSSESKSTQDISNPQQPMEKYDQTENDNRLEHEEGEPTVIPFSLSATAVTNRKNKRRKRIRKT